jgi:hypothetical protein
MVIMGYSHWLRYVDLETTWIAMGLLMLEENADADGAFDELQRRARLDGKPILEAARAVIGDAMTEGALKREGHE